MDGVTHHKMKIGPVTITRKLVWILLAITVVLYTADGVLRVLADFGGLRCAAHVMLAAWALSLLLLWKEWAAYLTAALYVACFPHLRLGVLGFVCLVPVMLDAFSGDRKRAMWLGWLAGTVANTGKLYWLVYTISYFSPIPFAAAVAILLLLTSFLGLYWMAGFGLTYWAVRQRGLPFWLVFPVSWVFWDWMLVVFLGGFPWDILGCAAFHVPLLDQSFDLVGEHGMGWLLAFGNVAFYELWRFYRKQRAFPKVQMAVLGTLVIAALFYGAVRTSQISSLMQTGRPIRIGVVQGNVDQNMKWKSAFRNKVLDDYAALAKTVANQGAELIIFPETAIPRRQYRWNKALHPEISAYARDTQRWVLTGVPSMTKRDDPDDPRGENRSHNSAVLISPEGEAVSWYDKNRLVPFGEFIPKKHWLERIARVFGKEKISGTLNFEPSGEYHIMRFPIAPFSVFICYEAVYPSTVRKLNRLGAQFLVTITNDAWFGKTSAPYQHWSQVAIRAIENRRYVARAANTGISGFIDPLGRTIIATDLYVPATRLGVVRTMDVQTIYDRFGDVAVYSAAAIYLAALAYALVGRRKKEQAA